VKCLFHRAAMPHWAEFLVLLATIHPADRVFIVMPGDSSDSPKGPGQSIHFVVAGPVLTVRAPAGMDLFPPTVGRAESAAAA
jgi:hypothetical protein